MKKLLSRLMVAASICAVMLSVSCNKEDISPVTTNVYNSMVSLWQQRALEWYNGVDFAPERLYELGKAA